MKNKIIAAIIIGLLIVSILFFCFWRFTVNSLKNTKTELQNAQAVITSLNLDNKKLIEYITQKNDTIKELKEKYNEVVSNIPADQCGDTKPSKELLNYFKKAYNK